jgi:hypothetical protein
MRPRRRIRSLHSRAARAAGVGVELDVRLTVDEVPVVFHDAGLERMCGHREWIARDAGQRVGPMAAARWLDNPDAGGRCSPSCATCPC